MSSSVGHKKTFAMATLGLVGAFTLSGCGWSNAVEQFTPLPDEQRYSRVNDVRDNLGYSEAGEVLTARYDHGDGVFSPSFFQAGIEGDEAFSILTERAKTLTPDQCETLSETQTRCFVGVVSIEIWDESYNGYVLLRITDSSNGRESE